MMSASNARRLAWVLVGTIFLLTGIGLGLEVGTESPIGGASFPIVLLEFVSLSVFAIVGALIISRHPRHAVGWIWLLIAFSFGVDHFAWGYAYYGFVVHPGSLPGVVVPITWLYWLGRGTLGTLGITLLLLLFPDGRPLSRRWGILAWIAFSATAFLILTSALAPDPVIYFPFPTNLIALGEPLRSIVGQLRVISSITVNLCALAASLSLFIRLIQARGVERQQLKWFVYPAGFLPPAFLVIVLGLSSRFSSLDWVFTFGIGLLFLGLTGMGITSAIAIFRYHLWDIDIIIRRTLVYGALTVTLALVYLGSVVLMQNLLTAIGSPRTAVVTVLSTLIIAALFTPVRRWVQSAIDRRFYRRKYDAEKILAAFSARLRQEVDLERLTEDLLAVVEETFQPETTSIWLAQPRKYLLADKPY